MKDSVYRHTGFIQGRISFSFTVADKLWLVSQAYESYFRAHKLLLITTGLWMVAEGCKVYDCYDENTCYNKLVSAQTKLAFYEDLRLLSVYIQGPFNSLSIYSKRDRRLPGWINFPSCIIGFLTYIMLWP